MAKELSGRISGQDDDLDFLTLTEEEEEEEESEEATENT